MPLQVCGAREVLNLGSISLVLNLGSISLGTPSIDDGGRSLAALATRPCLRRTSCVYSRVAEWSEGRRAIRPEGGARGGRGGAGGSYLAELRKRTSEAEGPRLQCGAARTLSSTIK